MIGCLLIILGSQLWLLTRSSPFFPGGLVNFPGADLTPANLAFLRRGPSEQVLSIKEILKITAHKGGKKKKREFEFYVSLSHPTNY